ncbi:MAG TPA: hypothetical protein VFA33_08830 [Bryobacteraceae bacterium]|nr:hypothetical protein [Bryobacteraceae bacterium]
MELPFEAAKGAVEKGLLVRFPIFMRVVLPGALASAVLYPTVAWLLGRLPANAEQIWQRFAAFAVCVFVIGALISTLTSEIYKIYEGRIFWPDRLLRWGERLQEARLRRFRQKAETARRAGDTARYDEAWYQLRLYPINEQGEPYVYRPTLLGNILAGYEQYPDNRYGMDSVFYWPRIWLQMEKEKKEAIDSQWSVADGFLLLSAICLAGGVLWLAESAAAVAGLWRFTPPAGGPGWAALAALGWWLAGYGFYRFSLPFHRENGELFKAIFDLYRAGIWEITNLRPQEKQTWDAAWSYLQYLRVVCPNCTRMIPVSTERCTVCGYDLKPLLENLRATGKLPMQP